MIKYLHKERLDGLPFDEYLQLNAFSNSRIKSMEKPDANYHTMKILVGKMVDQILEGKPIIPTTVNEHTAVRIANEILEQHPQLINNSDKQVSFFGEFQYEGFKLDFKTRPDFVLGDIATIDLKVTWEKNIDGLVEFMQYERQMSIHKAMSGCIDAYLLIYSVPRKSTFLVNLPNEKYNLDFLIPTILDYGSVTD